MEKRTTNFRRWLSLIRTFAAWLVIPAFISMYIAHRELTFTGFPLPEEARTPGFMLTLWWRNISLMVVLAASLLSFPRWPSLVGLGGLIIFMFLFGSQ